MQHKEPLKRRTTKKPYEAPKLLEYGSVAKLTHLTGSFVGDPMGLSMT